MAIHKDIEVTVQVNGADLVEYDDDEQEDLPGKTISKYIEVKAGDSFNLHMKCPETAQLGCECAGLVYHVQVDGIAVDDALGEGIPHDRLTRGVFQGSPHGGILKTLHFGDVEHNDEVKLPKGVVDEYKLKLAKVGMIEVKVCRAKRTWASPHPKALHYGGGLEVRHMAVPKKALLQRSNWLRASLDSGQPSAKRIVRAEKMEERENPFIVFRFLYRTHRALEALRIIQPLEERDEKTLSIEELCELVRRLREELKRGPLPTPSTLAGKRETSPRQANLGYSVKRETSPTQAKLGHGVKRETSPTQANLGRGVKRERHDGSDDEGPPSRGRQMGSADQQDIKCEQMP